MVRSKMGVVLAALVLVPIGWLGSSHVAAAADPPVVSGSGSFTQLSPTRVVDTRSGLGGTRGPVAPGATFDVQIAGLGGVPSDASAVALNLTVDRSVKAGFVTLYPAGGINEGSNVNPTSAGHTIANLALVALPPSGRLTVFAESGGDILMDVAGYWTRTTMATSGRFVSTTPFRTLDTRRPGLSKLAAGTEVNARVAGINGIPLDASAVAVTVTAADATGAGYVTAWAAGRPRPEASISNQPNAGSTVPNLAIVPVGTGGEISIYSSGGAHVLVDVAGWFTGVGAESSNEGLFVPVTPTRIADSRVPGAFRRLSAGLTSELSVPIPGGVPLGIDVGAVAVNLTVADPFDDGYVTASPAQIAPPEASNLNYLSGASAAGMALSRLGANGSLNLYSYSTADAVVDVAGWFIGAPASDGGFRPTRCENLMQYLHEERGIDQRSVKVVDRTSQVAPWTLATGPGVYGRIGLRCEYVLLFRPNSDGTQRVSRIDVLGTQPERPVVSDLSESALTPSADGRSLLYLEPRVDNMRATRIFQLDVRTGAVRLVTDMQGQMRFYDVSDVSFDGRTVDATATLGDGALRVTKIDLQAGHSTFLGWLTQPVTWETELAPNGWDRSYIVSLSDDTDGLVLGRDLISVMPGVYRSRFTPQGDLVLSHQTGPITISSAPSFETALPLLDDVVNYAPNFPKFALM